MIYYLLAILNNIRTTTEIMTVISFISLGSLTIFLALLISEGTEIPVYLKKFHRALCIVASIMLILATFIPSQKQVAFIILAPAIVENKDMQETLKNIPEIARLGTEYLKEMLQEKK